MEGCNRELINPSMSQIIHNIFGGLVYLIVPFLLIVFGLKAKSWTDSKSYSVATLVCGIISLVFAWLMMASPNGPYVGLFQRIVEGAILFWIVRTALFLKNAK